MAEWSKVLTAVSWPLMVWSTLALGTYQFRFVSWVFHVIFSFVHFISLYTLGDLRAFRKHLPYNMYLFNLRTANHILIIIIKTYTCCIRREWWGESCLNDWKHHIYRYPTNYCDLLVTMIDTIEQYKMLLHCVSLCLVTMITIATMTRHNDITKQWPFMMFWM